MQAEDHLRDPVETRSPERRLPVPQGLDPPIESWVLSNPGPATAAWPQPPAGVKPSPRGRKKRAGPPGNGDLFRTAAKRPSEEDCVLLRDACRILPLGEIAFKSYDELRDAPAVVAVSVSNGTTLAGIYKGFVRLYRRGKTSRIPKMVAGSSSGKNPIVRSFAKRLEVCEDLDPARLHETAVNEPLINWHSADGQQALDALRASGGWAGNASAYEEV